MKRGANLFEPESVKATIMSQSSWSNSTKALLIAGYKKFAVINNIKWIPPNCEVVRKLPFIPLEKDIDELIASCGKKLSAVLQLFKETGMRIGEARNLDWNDVDFEKRTIVLNNPEKRGNPRMFKVSEKLMAMLNRLPRDGSKVFGDNLSQTMFNNFNAQRKRSAKKLGNSRLLKIHFHTLRHWKATMEYHRTKDILYVMKLLGHKSISNTLVYTQLMESEGDEYHSAVANGVDEAKKLIEAGFDYVCSHGNFMIFRSASKGWLEAELFAMNDDKRKASISLSSSLLKLQ